MKAQPRGTDGSLLSSLPWTLLALLIALASHLPYLPIWITAAFFGCALWRFTIEKQRRLLPSHWIRAGLAVVSFLGVFSTYSSISGVGPGSALLAVMAALKLLETRIRRDQYVLLFISIFLVMSSLLREQHIWSLPYLLIGTVIIMTAWLRLAAGNEQSAKQSFSTSGRLILYALPLAIVMWVLFPRLGSPFWAVPIDTSQGRTGLSETMSPGDISSLSLSDEVAFRVSFEGTIPPPRDRYWRGLVLTRFNGRTWRGLQETAGGLPSKDQIAVSGDPIRYEVTLEPTRQHWIFALEMAYEHDLRKIYMGAQQQLAHITPIDQRMVYSITSFTNYKVQAGLSKADQALYRLIPQSSNTRSVDLAQDMRQTAGSDTAYVDAVLQMFNTQEFFYTLEPPPLGNNPVDRFLFDTKRGFCEHYASAFAFMMRSAGIPARIVLGYQGGEVNPIAGHIVVRQSDAHAWTEIWLPEFGWYRIDPTAAVAPERIEYEPRDASLQGIAQAWGFSSSSEFIHNMTMTWDALNAQWNEWVLGYGPENQNRFMKWLGMSDPDWQKLMLTLVVVVSLLVALISTLLLMRYRPPRKDRAAELYARFVKKTGLQQRVGETSLAFAARATKESEITPQSVRAVTSAYLETRYGPPRADALKRLEQEVTNVA